MQLMNKIKLYLNTEILHSNMGLHVHQKKYHQSLSLESLILGKKIIMKIILQQLSNKRQRELIGPSIY